MIKCSNITIVCFLLAFLCLPLFVFSQSKKELEEKRKKIIRDSGLADTRAAVTPEGGAR